MLNAQVMGRIPNNPNTGRYFMDHPHINVCTTLISKRSRLLRFYPRHRPKGFKHAVKAAWTLTESIKRTDALTNMSFEPIRTSKTPAYADGVHQLNRYVEPASPEAFRPIMCHLRAEQVPNPDSRIRLTSDRDVLGLQQVLLDWRLTALDHECIERSVRRLAGAFGRVGLGRTHSRVQPDGGWPRGQGGYHHMGATRMADTEQTGVVDAHCRVFGTDNLYVASSSVFPTVGYANPTYTIVALALRLADHLETSL